MKKIFAAIISSVLLFSSAQAETLKLPVEGEFHNQPAGNLVRDKNKTIQSGEIILSSDENALVVRFEAEKANKMEYFISLYDNTEERYVTSNEIPGCPVNMVGPISEGEFKFTGLKGGNSYSVRIATAINYFQLEGAVYGATLEPAKDTVYPAVGALVGGAGKTKDLSAGLRFNSDDTVSRANMCVLIRNLLPPLEKAVQAISFKEYPFSDVFSGDYAKNSIDELCALKVINGAGNGKFLPDSPVTKAAAVKMLICSLGYGGYAESLGGWPEGYLTCGRELGLYDGEAPDSIAAWQDINKMLSQTYSLSHLCMSEYADGGKAVYYQNSNVTYANMQ